MATPGHSRPLGASEPPGALVAAAPADVRCIDVAPGADVVASSHSRPPGSGAEAMAGSHARPLGTAWPANYLDVLYLQLWLPLLVLLLFGRGQGRRKGSRGGTRRTRRTCPTKPMDAEAVAVSHARPPGAWTTDESVTCSHTRPPGACDMGAEADVVAGSHTRPPGLFHGTF